jgi:hypothetical protein
VFIVWVTVEEFVQDSVVAYGAASKQAARISVEGGPTQLSK